MDKQLSLLYHWRLQNVRRDKHLFSTTFVGTNSHCDLINALCPKPLITWKYFLVFWQWDQYHYPFQIQSDLFKSFEMNRVARWNAYIFQFYFFADIVRSPSPVAPWARNLALSSWANAATARQPKNCDCALCKYVLYHAVVLCSYAIVSLCFVCCDSCVVVVPPFRNKQSMQLGGKPPYARRRNWYHLQGIIYFNQLTALSNNLNCSYFKLSIFSAKFMD